MIDTTESFFKEAIFDMMRNAQSKCRLSDGYKMFRGNRYKAIREMWCAAKLVELAQLNDAKISIGSTNEFHDDVDVVLDSCDQITYLQIVEATVEEDISEENINVKISNVSDEDLILSALNKKLSNKKGHPKYNNFNALTLLIYCNKRISHSRNYILDLEMLKRSAVQSAFKNIYLLVNNDIITGFESQVLELKTLK